MSKIKCITFDKEAQSKIPKDIREKMNMDRVKALKEHEYFKRLLDDIKNSGLCELSINFDYGNDMVAHLEKTRLAQYEFTVHYEISIKNHVESSYLNPEEFDCDFTIKNASELIIYDVKNRIIDITDEQNDEILTIIKSKLL